MAWDPCSRKKGSFFPHPTDCNLYFQCSHKKSILQKCTGDLLFDVDANNCVQDRPGLQCPDETKAPPKPPSVMKEPVPHVTEKVFTTTLAPITTTSNDVKTKPIYPSRPGMYCFDSKVNISNK